ISGVSQATANTWPPVQGTYDTDQRVTAVGELTKFGLALTYEEVRTAVMALVQSTQPSLASKEQLFNVLNALVASVASRSATWADYKAAWDAFFQNTLPGYDPHTDPTKIPQASGLVAAVASVIPLAQSTDQVARFRITAAAGGIGSSANPLIQVTYATPYQRGATTIAPIVIAEPTHTFSWAVTNVTPNGYQVILSAGAILGGQTYDLKILSIPGITV
ncbi:MAG: hypothetical protein JNJ46_04420, partial [Myxococcales bacterium]|nr:hypothetical protein [Myxococcales bacterium]